MTRRESFGNCGLLGMLAALWPWGGEPQPKADPWRDVLDEAFRKVRDDGWVQWVARPCAELGHADWSRVGKIYRRADGKQVWLMNIEDIPSLGAFKEPRLVTYAFVRRRPLRTYGPAAGKRSSSHTRS